MSKEMGLRVKRLRQIKGWSQAELAKRCKVSQQNIGQIEAGKPGNPACLAMLSTALSTTEQYLRYGDQQADIRNGIVAINKNDGTQAVQERHEYQEQPYFAPIPAPQGQTQAAWPEVALKQPRQQAQPQAPKPKLAYNSGIDDLIETLIDAKIGGVMLDDNALKMAKYAATLVKEQA